MKKLMLLAAIACLGTLAACASTAAVTKSEEDELTKLRRQNAELRQQVTALRPVQSPVMDPADMMPPPAQRRVFPPQNWGWINQRPEGCDSGIYSLEIRNATEYYVDLLLDGERIKIRGARGVLPAIPPQETIWVCLGSLGTHTFRGKFYACRGGPGTRSCQLNEIGQLHIIDQRSTKSMFMGRQYMEITDSNVHDD